MTEKTFLEAVAAELRCDLLRAESVSFAVLQELRDRLTASERRDVAAQLPTGLRRLWDTGDRPDRPPDKVHAPEFVGRVRQRAVLPDDDEAARAVRVVFRQLQRLLGSPTGMEGEAWDVFSQLPKDLKRLWLDAGR